GLAPSARSIASNFVLGMAYSSGTPANSASRISSKARPIQSASAVELKFSNRSTASRCTPGAAFWCEQDSWAHEIAASDNPRAICGSVVATRGLQNTRRPLHQFLELGKVLQRGEVRLLGQGLLILESLFERRAKVLQRQIVAPRRRVHFGQVEVVLGALRDAGLFENLS